MKNNLLKKHAKSFYWASFFLSKETYNKCSSLYNFCRTLDDIADDNSDLEIKKENFLKFKKNFANKNFENPIIKNMWDLLENEKISKIVIDDFDESTQLAILISKPVLGYDIINSKASPSTVIFIHTEMRKSEVANLKKHIDEEGVSVFNVAKN